MELTKEVLLNNGFETNHPERILCKMFLTNNKKPEWRVTVTQEFIPLTNSLAFNIDCWRSNEVGTIVKRSSVHFATTVEELTKAMELCDIDYKNS